MNQTTDPTLLDKVAALWRESDPMPAGLAHRMTGHARAEARLVAVDWDNELMQLVERSRELAGTRSTAAAYLLRFTHADRELLLRVASGRAVSRIDGWLEPAEPVTVRVLGPDGTVPLASVDPIETGVSGRFAIAEAPAGLVRLRLESEDPERTTILTPTFEI